MGALDRSDDHHHVCAVLLRDATERRVIPTPVLVEVDYFYSLIGPSVFPALLSDLESGASEGEDLRPDDYTRASASSWSAIRFSASVCRRCGSRHRGTPWGAQAREARPTPFQRNAPRPPRRVETRPPLTPRVGWRAHADEHPSRRSATTSPRMCPHRVRGHPTSSSDWCQITTTGPARPPSPRWADLEAAHPRLWLHAGQSRISR